MRSQANQMLHTSTIDVIVFDCCGRRPESMRSYHFFYVRCLREVKYVDGVKMKKGVMWCRERERRGGSKYLNNFTVIKVFI